MTRLGTCCLLLSSLVACEEATPPRVSGKPIIGERSHDVYLSPNGQYVATLVDPEPSKELGAPQDILLGTLTIIPVGGGKSTKLGADVPNLPGKVVYSKDGAYIACVAGFSVHHDVGELRIGRVGGGDVESLADGVTYFAFSGAGGRIAYISGGDLFVRSIASGSPKKVAENVAMFEFNPAGDRMLVKRLAQSGGNLGLYEVSSGKLTELARGVVTFGFSPAEDAFVFRAEGLLVPGVLSPGGPLARAAKDVEGFYRVVGTSTPTRLSGDNISNFKFDPRGNRVAWVTPSTGTSTVGDLYISESDVAKKVASRVVQFEFAPDGTLVLEGVYQAASQAGTLGYLPTTGPLVELARDVRAFTISPKGKYVLYSRGVSTNSSFTLALEIHRIGAPPDEKPRRVDTGVFGYVLDEQENRLAYKARCSEGGQACSLFVADLARASEPVLLAQRVSAFDFALDPRGIVIVTSQHVGKLTGRLTYSLGVVAPEKDAKVQVLDDQMDGDFTLGGPNRDLAIYVVSELHRQGLYTSSLTPPAPVAATP